MLRLDLTPSPPFPKGKGEQNQKIAGLPQDSFQNEYIDTLLSGKGLSASVLNSTRWLSSTTYKRPELVKLAFARVYGGGRAAR